MRNDDDNTEIDLSVLWNSAPTLMTKGWHPVPITPRTKACRIENWTRFCVVAPDAAELAAWGSDRRGYGVGLTLGRSVDDGTVLMCLDWDVAPDNEARATAVEAALGIGSAPAKAGARGWSCFIRVSGHDGSTRNAALIGAPPIVGADGREHVQMVQLLGVGAQTVIPPTEHPDLGRPYVWLDGRSLWPRGESGKPTIVPVEELPIVEWGDLVEALADAGFDVGNLRSRTDAAKPAAIAFEELDEAAVVELLDRLEFDGADLGDLWTNGSDARVFERRGKTASGNERRHELAYQMRKAGYVFADYVAALREWRFTVGNKPFDVDEDLSRSNSRLVNLWEGAGRRLASAVSEPTEAFGAADDGDGGDEAGSGPGAGLVLPFLDAAAVEAVDMRGTALTLISGLLGTGAAAMVYGPAHAGKSTLVHSLCEHVALGLDVLGRSTERVGAAWLAYEDASGAIVRQRLGQHMSGRHHPMIVVDGMAHDLPCLLGEDREIKAFANAIVATLAEAERRSGVSYKIVVIDTLMEGMMGMGDESSGRDMRRALRLVKLLEKAGLCPIVVHHSGKDASRGARGWSGLNGYFTTIVEVREGEIAVEKARGGSIRKGTTIPFSLVDTPLPWSNRSPDAVQVGDFVGAPRVEFGMVKAPSTARRGPSKTDRPSPGTVAGEVFSVLDRKGAMTVTEIVEAVAADRLAHDPDAPASELDRDKIRRAVRTATARWSEKGVLTLVEGRWTTADGLLGAHFRALGDEEAA